MMDILSILLLAPPFVIGGGSPTLGNGTVVGTLLIVPIITGTLEVSVDDD